MRFTADLVDATGMAHRSSPVASLTRFGQFMLLTCIQCSSYSTGSVGAYASARSKRQRFTGEAEGTNYRYQRISRLTIYPASSYALRSMQFRQTLIIGAERDKKIIRGSQSVSKKTSWERRKFELEGVSSGWWVMERGGRRLSE
jgi:hypothetical protein